MAYAYDYTGDGDYVDGVTSAMDYILGRNPMENSYVTGYGDHYTKYVHHRYWSYLLDPDFPLAPAGVLAGGPNSGMQDPYIKGAGYKVGTLAPQKCYLDHIEAWSANECTINWNSPLAWVVSFMEDEYDAPVGDGTLSDLDGEVSSSTDLKFSSTTVTVPVGDTANLRPSSGKVSSWSSSNESVATVDDNGKVTGVSEGTATVTATDADGNKVDITVNVTGDTVDTTTTTSTSDIDNPSEDTTTTTASQDTDKDPAQTTVNGQDSTDSRLWGDVNVDGEVNAVDLVILKKYILTMIDDSDIPDGGLLNADVKNDGEITSVDLLLLKKYLLTMIEYSDLGQK
jgi:hypothetical protein